MLRQFFYLLIAVLLSACANRAQQLGMSTEQWQSMSKNEQKQAVDNYRQIKKSLQKQNETSSIYDGPRLSIYMLKGSAMMPPFEHRYSFQTQHFVIDPGPCRIVRLESVDTTHHVNMRLCYNGLRVTLDPSRYEPNKRQGTAAFDYNPVWKRGFTYSDINTHGYVRLKDASISIKALGSHG